MGTDTKSQILSAAIELFAQHGYEKTTMRTIAKEVGIQSASIYYFFNSKESLLKAIFAEFESNFARYRNSPEDIFKAARERPLADALSMMFYTFGEPSEHVRMMTIARVILSLQYENADAQELIERVMMTEALDYDVRVFEGLYSLGKIKKTDFKWMAFIIHSFAFALFQKNLRNMSYFEDTGKEFEEGIGFICSSLAKTMEV